MKKQINLFPYAKIYAPIRLSRTECTVLWISCDCISRLIGLYSAHVYLQAEINKLSQY